ncbi:MAG: DUF1592 domain-containing protein [Verrucomicrobia bacterium]|nr:DUF1592 domain-containing protein [Verrucomicrobiota bacterium]
MRPRGLRVICAFRGFSASSLALVALITLASGASGQSEVLVTSPFFEKNIRPLLSEYCLTCHSTEKQKGELDLERFVSLDAVKRHPKVWQRVAEQLADLEMPPKDKPQPSAAERDRLSNWVRALLDNIARARAGDPGPVVLRRLSNAEYSYTLRDLTGIESLDPAREFPVDGAAGEGFMNTGNSLVMSPALLRKYLDAGKDIAGHAVLLPDGIRFSPKTTRRDWTEEILAEIRGFYREFTSSSGASAVNLQGIKFDTNEGGRLPLEKYLEATLEMRAALLQSAPSSLAPALSPGERENRTQLSKNPNAANPIPARDRSLPLPGGEGRGEGKARVETQKALISSIAAKGGLSPKYLQTLWDILSAQKPSLLIDPLRARWREAKSSETPALAAEFAKWQNVLWKFASVGHIGKAGGPKAWMEPVSPLTTKEEIRLKIPPATNRSEVTLYLVATDAGDGNEHDFVVWEQPRLVASGRPNLLIRDVREVTRELAQRRAQVFASTAKCLMAAAEAGNTTNKIDVAALASRHGVETDALIAWLDFLGLGSPGATKIDSYFTTKIPSSAGYDFVKGWGSHSTPLLVANSSDQHVRIPGNMKPHSVAVHPSPKLQAAVAWRSPVAATVRVEANVTHAHPECGNGVAWSLELRRGATRQRLASGIAQGSREAKVGPIEKLSVQTGDLVSLLIGPRDGNHSCDLTAIDLSLTTSGEGGREWNLARDVSGDVTAGNPHADRFGNDGVWHFYTEPDKGGGELGPVIPVGSLLARWQSSEHTEERQTLAEELQRLLTSGPPANNDGPDAALYRQLASLGGPLFSGMMRERAGAKNSPPRTNAEVSLTPALSPGEREKRRPSSENPGASIPIPARDRILPLPAGEGRGEGERAGQTSNSPNLASAPLNWSLDPAIFGRHPNGQPIDAASLCVLAPSVIEVRLPADLVEGCEFVTTGSLHSTTGAEGSVQLQVLTTKPERESGLLPSSLTVTQVNGMWTSNNRRTSHATPIVVNEGSQARRRIESDFDEFRQVFPAALCYTKIVPVDEVVTLTLFYREDDHLRRLMLDETQTAKLNRLWDELHYVSHDALTLVDAFEQLWQYATQDADPKVFEPLRKPIQDRAAAFRQLLIDTQPKHVEGLLEFADRAYRRPITDSEKEELRGLYRKLREQELPHEEAVRLTLARVLVAPAFLYRLEKPRPGVEPSPVPDWELASRLSYFLWSTMPDDELRQAAASGRLHDPEVLAAQTRRMLRDPRVRRLATEFACQWLHIYDFDELDEKSERHFPTFIGLRGAMYEEPIRFFTDFFQRNGSVLDILDADYTFLNETLAKHYEIAGVTGSEWQRVDGVKKFSRGGILGLGATLAKQSGASRTSPILRGNWIVEVLLGEKLPRPPKEVPRLPEDETATEGLTVRQLVEKHTADLNCSRCHMRIDPYGYALESFDAIGRKREKDLGDRPIDTRVKAMDGAQFEGIAGLRNYLLTTRRDAFLRQFCRKLLGYALGRAVQLSDEPLLAEMQAQLKSNGYRIGTAMESIVHSRQFREIRGKEAPYEE